MIDFGTSQKFDPKKKMTQTYGTAYYIAPEVLKSEYDEKCDVWSVGVILYILLAGKPPFDGNEDKEIIDNVKRGRYDIGGSEWEDISKEGIEFIKKMLCYDPKNRIGAADAINHIWIKKKVNEPVDERATLNALNNLRTFRVLTCLYNHCVG